MALSDLGKKIRRFHLLHAKGKAIDAELDALKAFFKEEAGDKDAVFESRDLQVPVTWKERSGGWDGPKLEASLGAKAAQFKKPPSRYAEVTCRRKET